MQSWVYIFSKFTPEALLLELLVIGLLCALYAGYWIVRKRKLGVVENVVPAGLIQQYLSELIYDAEEMRKGLFGLLRSAGIDIPMDDIRDRSQRPIIIQGQVIAQGGVTQAGAPAAAPSADGQTANDPATAGKLAELEAKMAQKDTELQAILTQKDKMEQDLTAAKTAQAEGGGGDSKGLQDKINTLEARLAEYSVIEDDLANLKKLQQENAQLKAQLAAAASAAPVAAAIPAAAAPAPQAQATNPAADALASVEAALANTEATPTAAASPAADPAADALASVEAALAGVTTPEAAPTPAAAPAISEQPDFEQLAAEAALSVAAAPPPPIETAPATAAAEATPAAPPPGDQDLVAEFEKMLNG